LIKVKVVVPLLNVNEPEAQVVDVCVQECQWVDSDTPICVLETTKSTFEVTSPEAGYVRQLNVSVGDIVTAGDLICVITDSPDEPVELALPQPKMRDSEEGPVPEGLRITKPALALARKLGVDLSQLSHRGIVTEVMIRKMAGLDTKDRELPIKSEFDMRIVIYGGGGHAKSVIDLIRQLHTFRIVGVVDDALSPGTTVLGIPVLGARDILPKLLDDGIRLAANGIGGITDITARVEIFHALAQLGFAFPILRHPESIVEPSAVLEDGVQVFANAYIGSDVILKEGCIINTGAIVSHDCVIGEYAHIAPGAMLAGGVRVGARTLIGMGVATATGIHIGSDVRIGNGALVHQDVPDKTIILAGTIWPAARQE